MRVTSLPSSSHPLHDDMIRYSRIEHQKTLQAFGRHLHRERLWNHCTTSFLWSCIACSPDQLLVLPSRAAHRWRPSLTSSPLNISVRLFFFLVLRAASFPSWRAREPSILGSVCDQGGARGKMEGDHRRIPSHYQPILCNTHAGVERGKRTVLASSHDPTN
ncbi:hypothetical protein GQ53DRAFT_43402 [Thozetella sp. PMI_491]|nr:hypothetical protein GQ53DRAFT_43402 [Thozetella sp. PMI_491]